LKECRVIDPFDINRNGLIGQDACVVSGSMIPPFLTLPSLLDLSWNLVWKGVVLNKLCCLPWADCQIYRRPSVVLRHFKRWFLGFRTLQHEISLLGARLLAIRLWCGLFLLLASRYNKVLLTVLVTVDFLAPATCLICIELALLLRSITGIFFSMRQPCRRYLTMIYLFVLLKQNESFFLILARGQLWISSFSIVTSVRFVERGCACVSAVMWRIDAGLLCPILACGSQVLLHFITKLF